MKLSKMNFEDLEQLSYNEIAKLYLEETNKEMTTAELFKKICELLQLSEQDYNDKIADFFQSLTTSKDFILLSDGKWDLKSKHSVKIMMDELYEETFDENDNEEYDNEPDNVMSEEDEYNSIDDEEDYADDELNDLTILTEDELENEE